MKNLSFHTILVGMLMAFLTLPAFVGFSQAQVVIGDWPDLYDPFTLHSYHLTMTRGDWNTIRNDLTYDIEVPALFSAEDEDPILVSVRRKSATAFPINGSPEKVSLKVDINEFTGEDDSGFYCEDTNGFPNPNCVDKWKDVKKLSLENGDDNNTVTEGFAWYLHRLAAEYANLDYKVGLANWVTLDITLIDNPADGNEVDYLGPWVYVNVEQPDKTFLKNRDLWEGGDDTWFYEYDDRYLTDYEEAPEDENGNPIDSPGYIALNYWPFQYCKGRNSGCDEQPEDEQFVADLNKWINMEGMLTYNAVAAFSLSSDDLFSNQKNFLFVDYSLDPYGNPLHKREYVEWDLDSALKGKVNSDIYSQGKRSPYEEFIINETTFKGQYTEIMRDLLLNVFIVADLQSDLDAIEDSIGAAVAADPYNALPDPVHEYFEGLKQWIADRHANVLGQLP